MSPSGFGELTQDERDKFSKYLYDYRYDSEIIQEGSEDKALYLLREGSIGVYRVINQDQRQIARIDAVNFFGEMASITGGARTATVRVISPTAIVYKFPVFDLKLIYSNPAWSELLITRLANDLIETNNRSVALENEKKDLLDKRQAMVEQVGVLLAALYVLQGDIAADVVMNSKEWAWVQGMRDLINQFLEKHLPEISAEVKNPENRKTALKKLKNTGALPDLLKPLA